MEVNDFDKKTYPSENLTQTPVEHLTDLGNARRLIVKHGQELRYCTPWKKWVVWDGRRWITDDTEHVVRLAKAIICELYADAGKCVDPATRAELARWALKSESADKIRAMIESARNEPGVPVLPQELDPEATNWLLNCKNGTLDLRTGKLRPHDPKDLITRMVDTFYDPDAKAPRFEQFISEIFDGSEDLARYVQKLLGYSISGSVEERCLFFLYGIGKNGKSKLMNILLALLGPYAQKAAPNLLIQKKWEEHPTGLASLKGSRVVVCNEVDSGRKLAESLTKELTGADRRLKARFMHQDFFEFDPVCKIFIFGNHKPVIRGRDEAIWDRIKLIPFNVRFDGEREDKNLEEKLMAELPGFLAWCVRGCLLWQKEGLSPEPEEVKASVSSYRREMDELGDFIEEFVMESTFEEAKVSVKELYGRYDTWCKESNLKPLAKRAFNTAMEEHGFKKDPGAGNVLFWRQMEFLTSK